MNMFRKRRMRILVLIIVIIAISIFGFNPARVETVFSTGWYPGFSLVQRNITGWIPFSIGDVIYLILFFAILFSIYRFIKQIITRRINKHSVYSWAGRTVIILLFAYIIFQVFWGLNYNRLGVVHQFKLKDPGFDTTEILRLQDYLADKVNNSKKKLSSTEVVYPSREVIFERGEQVYHKASIFFPFLQYHPASIKSSLFGRIGNYLGFTGYYNPFTGEAQVNATVPKFLLPAITAHEVAHQLGYAKENEASFIGYLASINTDDALYRYSSYLDLFLYTNAQVNRFDSLAAKKVYKKLNDSVKADINEWQEFLLAHRSLLSRTTGWVYGKFLTWYNQPDGIKSYDGVVALVISYYKKHGVL